MAGGDAGAAESVGGWNAFPAVFPTMSRLGKLQPTHRKKLPPTVDRTGQAAHQNPLTSVERGGNNLNGFRDFRTENGSSQGRNLALTGVCVASWLASGPVKLRARLG